MPRRFRNERPTVGGQLPPETYGRLVARFVSASPIPLRGGRDTGRHIYLDLQVPDGSPDAGVYECAVNIRSNEGTEVLFTRRIEPVDPGSAPGFGFDPNVGLSYGTGGDPSDGSYLGLTDADFRPIVNDELYQTISDLAQSCSRVAACGVTYSDGTGIHDIHMNSGTDPSDYHARDDRVHQDGAIAFYFDLQSGGQQQGYATWVLIRFSSQSVVESE